MMNKLVYAIMFFFLFLFSCKQEKDSPKRLPLVISVDIKNVDTKKKYSDFVEDCKYIPLETKDSSLIIREINKVQIDDDKIFVLDLYLFRGVMVFDTSGKYLYHLKAGGGAEGEFEHISDFDIDRKTKNLIIYSTPNLMYYSYTGKFLKKESLPFFATNFSTNHYNKVFIGQEFDLIATDSTNKKILELFDKSQLHPLSFQQPLQSLEDKILYRHYLNDTIYAITDAKLIPHVVIDFADKKLNKEEINIMIKNKERNFPSNKMGKLKYYFETKQHIYFAFLYNQMYYVTYYNKNSEKSITIRFDNSKSNDITYEKTVPLIVGAYKDYFICSAFIENIYLEKLVPHPFQINLSKSFSKKNVDRPENPNLVLIQLKSF